MICLTSSCEFAKPSSSELSLELLEESPLLEPLLVLPLGDDDEELEEALGIVVNGRFAFATIGRSRSLSLSIISVSMRSDCRLSSS